MILSNRILKQAIDLVDEAGAKVQMEYSFKLSCIWIKTEIFEVQAVADGIFFHYRTRIEREH